MLVLSRKTRETVLIGEGTKRIEITVQRVRGRTVSLGISGAREVRVLRKELEKTGGGR